MGRKRGIHYKPASFYRSDDRSGFTVRAENTEKEWTGLIVDKNLWEARQPQDFVRGVPDDQTVPDPRPVPGPVYIGPINTTLTANVAIGATFLPLESVFGFSAGDKIGVMTDLGEYFNTTQVGNSTPSGINIATPLPSAAASGNTVTDYESADGP